MSWIALHFSEDYFLFFLQIILKNPPRIEPQDDPKRQNEELNSVLPSSHEPYDMHEIIRKIVDNYDFLQVQRHWAKNIIIGLARLDGNTVGIVANNPQVLAGVFDIDSCDILPVC